MTTASEIRASFLRYFERHGHRIVPSSSLVPHDDPTLLFTNAGMNQFKDLFLGKERREYRRAASAQKCMRVSGKHNDLDNVGPSLRHHTFFEMLGNFSFGDYFKEGAIDLAWQLLTAEWSLPPSKLVATIFGGEGGIPRDDEAHRFWRRFLPADQIVELGLADNFWAMGDTGPCGRCSEVHYFRGRDLPCPEPVCRGVACSCDRYVELWNNVFMEFDRQVDGRLNPLPAPSIDTGMGLERVSAVLQGTISNYDTDLFAPLLARIGEVSGLTYSPTPGWPSGQASDRSNPSPETNRTNTSMRVVADHARAMTFLIADGVVPSNEWRGYVLRKIMRRAMRHGMRLGLTDPFLYRLVDVLVGEMGPAYPELAANQEAVGRMIRSEEERFDAVLTGGLPRLEEAVERAASAQGVLPGEDAFRLYDTYGLPLDFVEDLASERHVSIDRAGFDHAMEAQRDKARAKSAFEGRKIQEFSFRSEDARQALSAAGDVFEGYATTVVRAVPILAAFDESCRQVEELREGASGYLALGRTPFYLEAGGQVSDTGEIRVETGAGRAAVDGVTRIAAGWPRVHRVRLVEGAVREGDLVTAEAGAALRDATRRSHTATHLLHAALRRVLGAHVRQAGSLVAPDRLRFDFVHFSPLTRDEINALERIVAEEIRRNTIVDTEERSIDEAIAAGATALFGEKYGERVRVVSVPGFSMELCGGTHCRATGDIGQFTVVSEGGIAAGVRRIEAITGADAVAASQAARAALDEVLGLLGTTADQARSAVDRLQADVKRLTRELSRMKVESARGQQGQIAPTVAETEIAGTTLVTQKATNLAKLELRQLADAHRDRIKSGVVVIASTTDERVSIVVSVSKDLTERIQAGEIVKQVAPMVGGSGGGRPDFAEAGGKDGSRVDEMLRETRQVVERLLSGAGGTGRQPPR
jgi:alanyl-tRNA synthetase